MKNFLTQLYQNKKVKTACWTIVNAFIVIAVVAMSDLNAGYIPFLIAGLNMLTKHINQTYLS